MNRDSNNRFTSAGARPLLSPYLITAIIVIAAVVLSILFWYLYGVNPSRFGSSSAPAEETAAVPEEEINVFKGRNPEAEDGTGAAGIMQTPTGMYEVSPDTGWHSDIYGWWYSPEEGGIYYNGWMDIEGNRYHFAENGYANIGWTAIGGEGYYFDSEKVYQPNESRDLLIALTFDDGPSEYTNELIDILDANNAKATFFLLGREIEKYGDAITHMASSGHIIGNHSYDHLEMLEQDMDTVVDQFARTDQMIAGYNNGNGASVVRFPYGDYTKEQSAAVGKPQIYWDIDTFDWDTEDINVIRQHIYDYLTGGNIILMHDIYPSTIEACRVLIPELQSQGYKFVTINELAASRGYELEPGVTYFSFKDMNIQEGRVTDEGQ